MIDSLTEQLRAGLADPGAARDSATAALRGQYAVDIASLLSQLDLDEVLEVFGWLDDRQAAEVLAELDPDLTRYLVEHAPPGRVVGLLDRMASDDAAEVMADSPDEQEQLLTDLSGRDPVDAAEVRELLSYSEKSAGRLMTPAFAVVPPQATAPQVLQYLRANANILETMNEIYVSDPGGRLLGVISLRALLTAGDWQEAREFMTTNPIVVSPETDQEEVARRIARYDLSAIPVTDAAGRLLGIVTVDDAIDILAEEFSEDYLHLAGTDAEAMERRTPIEIARLRLPWLLGTMAIELGAGVVIAQFADVLKEVILLASFMPVISAVSGNVGLQAAAIVVRGLDTGHVSLSRLGRQVSKELATSLLMALVCGLVLGTVGAIWSGHPPFGAVIGVAMTCSMLTAGVMGTVIPMLSKRAGFDPATTAGPFETAFQDVIGFAVFLWLASLLLQWLR